MKRRKQRSFSRDNRWRRSVTDPVLFCREFLGLEPHPGQVRWLQNSTRSENLLVTGNRWGKSLIQAAKIIHRAVFRIRDLNYDSVDRYNILNLSITQDQANIIFKNCLSLIKGNPLLELLVDRVTHTPYPRIRFGNGAVVTARSSQNRGEYILGHDFDFINFDEVAFELHPEYVVDEVLTMRLADRKGTLDLTSTPRGKNWFYKKYLALRKDKEGGYVQQGGTTENPHLATEYIAEKRETLPQSKVNQNILGLFVDSGDEILKEEYIQKSLTLSSGLADRVHRHRYVHGWDLARKMTYTVGVTLDVTHLPYQLVKLERFQKRDWPFVYEIIRKRKQEYGGETIVDATGVGDAALAHIADIKPYPFIFTARSKAELLTNLQSQFELGRVGIPYIETGVGEKEYWNLVDELREVTWENNSFADAMMALALALWQVRPQQKSALAPTFRMGEI